MAFPFIAVFAVAGAVLGGIAQRSKNKALKKSAILAQGQLNVRIDRAKVQFADNVQRRSAVGQMIISESRNKFGAQTGLSISERLASMAADMTVDTEALKASIEATISDIQFEKLRISASAEAQSKAIGFAAIEGAIAGAQMGASLQSSLANLKQVKIATGEMVKATSGFSGVSGFRQSVAMMQVQSMWPVMSSIARNVRGFIAQTQNAQTVGGLS